MSGPGAAEAPAADTAPDGGGPEAGPESVPATGADPSGGLAACLSGGAGAAQRPAPDPDAPSAGCGGGSGGGSRAGACGRARRLGGHARRRPRGRRRAAVHRSAAGAAAGQRGGDRRRRQTARCDAAARDGAAVRRVRGFGRRGADPAAAGDAVHRPVPADKVGTPAGAPTPAPNLQPTPSPSARQVAVATPRLGGDQQLTEADAAKVTESIDSVPTTDAELAVDAGDPGTVALQADADPALVGRQRQALATQVGAVATQGAKDAAAPLGEADIRPHVPPKTLTATPTKEPAAPGWPATRARRARRRADRNTRRSHWTRSPPRKARATSGKHGEGRRDFGSARDSARPTPPSTRRLRCADASRGRAE